MSDARAKVEAAVRAATFTESDVADKIIGAMCEVIGLGEAKGASRALGDSKIGGQPHLPADTDWPQDEDDEPLAFVAQLNLAHVPSGGRLPSVGILSFFSACGQSDELESKVIYLDDPSNLVALPFPDDLDETEWRFHERPLRAATSFLLVDDSDDVPTSFRLDGDDEETFDEILEAVAGATEAYMLGPPLLWDEDVGQELHEAGLQLVLKLAGESLWRSDDDRWSRYGEGSLNFFLSDADLKAGDFTKIELVFEGGS